MEHRQDPEGNTEDAPWPRLMAAGTLMGLANLVPGISGGTMLLALGVYRAFVLAMAEVGSGRPTRRKLAVLALLLGMSLLTILLLAAPVTWLLAAQPVAMYSLFIGLTLGGVPILLPELKPWAADALLGFLAGLLVMILVALWQQSQGGTPDPGIPLLFVSGILAAAAMVLPGISGSYLLLLLGVYVPILSGVAAFTSAVRQFDPEAILHIGLTLVLPVGIGVLIGLVAVTRLLRALLRHWPRPTHAALLGLLLGSVLGLWPFHERHEPETGEWLRGQQVVVDDDGQKRLFPSGKRLTPADHPRTPRLPSPGEALLALALIGCGTGITVGLARWTGRKEPRSATRPPC